MQEGNRAAERGGPARLDGLACGEEQRRIHKEQADRVNQDGHPREGDCPVVLVRAALDGYIGLEPFAVGEWVARESVCVESRR
jgi:hypothetical protein